MSCHTGLRQFELPFLMTQEPALAIVELHLFIIHTFLGEMRICKYKADLKH